MSDAFNCDGCNEYKDGTPDGALTIDHSDTQRSHFELCEGCAEKTYDEIVEMMANESGVY